MNKKSELAKQQDRSFGHVLFRCARLLDELAQAEVNRQAKQRLARPALMRLLPHLDFVGVRPTELAKRVDVSKQAIGVALGELLRQGLVEQLPDPTDRRARLVRLTKRGGRAFAHGLTVLAGFEQRLARELGRQPMKQLMSSLRQVDGLLASWSAAAS